MRLGKSIVRKSRIAHAILVYLAEHPEGEDTLEDIVEWWLLEQKIKRCSTRVKDALTELISQGFVLEHTGQDTRIHYGMNRHGIEEIRALLKGRSG